MKKTLGVLSIGGAILLAWAIWGPFLHWVYSVLPQNEWNKLLKVITAILVGYFGGIAVPLIFVCCGIYFLAVR